MQEAKTASSLNHPGIVTIHDITRHEGIDFIAMELVPGRTLDRVIPRHGLALREALDYGVQIADALAAAHSAGIVHRDLKPANVIVSEHGRIKVLDFGLAKLVGHAGLGAVDGAPTATHAAPVTEQGAIVGTVAYMSPEQAEGKPVDARTDIFSFGCVLYEMVTGQRAFQRDSAIATLSAILHEEPKPVSQLSERLPPEVERVIARCLRKDPERRWQSMADVKVALQDLKDELDSGSLVATSPAVGRPPPCMACCGGARRPHHRGRHRRDSRGAAAPSRARSPSRILHGRAADRRTPVESSRRRFHPMGAPSRSAGTESARRTGTSTSS